MRVGVCDFPSRYAFPPVGYGSIERWLWAVAVGAHRAGAEVCLLGPQWRRDLQPDLIRNPIRLEQLAPADRQVKELVASRYDLLVVGHEYPSLPAWRGVWERLECDVATFQHSATFRHAPDAFDGQRSRLYCYSPQMLSRYRAHRPIAELAMHLGWGEENQRPASGKDLVWLGRIDEEKAPHLAVLAARRLGVPIRLIGPIFDTDYLSRHDALLASDDVELIGQIGGQAKAKILSQARVLVYTCDRTYVEAGAAVFGESLRAGTPVAALVWAEGTCAEAALCPSTGSIAIVDPDADDDVAIEQLAEAIQRADGLDPHHVQDIGQDRFDPVKHFRALAAVGC